MRGLSFVVAAVVAAKSSAEQDLDNGYYLPTGHGRDAPRPVYYGEPAYMPQPQYVDSRYVTAEPRYMVEQPHYVQPQPHYTTVDHPQTRYIEVPAGDEYRYREAQPEIRYVEVPAQPVHQQPVHATQPVHHEAATEKVGKYVQVPQELYEKLLQGQDHHQVAEPVHVAPVHHESTYITHEKIPAHHEAAHVTHATVPVHHEATHVAPHHETVHREVSHHEPVVHREVAHHSVTPVHHEPVHHTETHRTVVHEPVHHSETRHVVAHPVTSHHEPVHAVAAHHDTPVVVHHEVAHPVHHEPKMVFKAHEPVHHAMPHHMDKQVEHHEVPVHHKTPESHHIEHEHVAHQVVKHAPVTHVVNPHHKTVAEHHIEASHEPMHVTGSQHHGAKTHHETVHKSVHHEVAPVHHDSERHLEVLASPAPVSHHEAPVTHHATPVHHAEPVHHAAPVHHAEPVHHAAPVHHSVEPVHHAAPARHVVEHVVHHVTVPAPAHHDTHAKPIHHEPVVTKHEAVVSHHEDPHRLLDAHQTTGTPVHHVTETSHKGEPTHYEGQKSHQRGHEGSEHTKTKGVFYEGDYPKTYKDHEGHPYAVHSKHDMDPLHHHMTSEYTHGHEYDTYHYEGKEHLQRHFTVTRPEEKDVVSKGSYYHAHPEDVSRSYPHHHEHHYYEVERVPVHHTHDHQYERVHHGDDYGYGYPVHEDRHPHYSEERHTYSGEAVHHERAGYLIDEPHHEVRHHGYGYAHSNSGVKAPEPEVNHEDDSPHHHYEAAAAEHGHHEAHYEADHHFYDSPYHHGGLHGEYDDPLAHEGHHSYYEDEEHVPHYTRHSEEPLTHSEEYYYGAPIRHFHHDYHHTDVSSSCWKKASGRTLGEPLSDCPEGMEKDGAICYHACKDGYHGVGPICWQDCPHHSTGFEEDGEYCYKPEAYGRGAGQVHQFSGSEQWGALWYPKCHDHFHNVGCCVCSPDCPAGMTDIGISCAKDSYSRAKGDQGLTCHKDQVQSGALCYPECEHGTGVGPVCWGSCPKGTKECGALCLGEDDICSEYVAEEVKIAFQLVVDAAEHTTAGSEVDTSHIGSELTFPNCPAW